MTSNICQENISNDFGITLPSSRHNTHSYHYWLVWSGKLWHMDVHVTSLPRAHNSALPVLFTTIKLRCFYQCYLLFGQ